MKKAREIDIMMAQKVLGHHIFFEKSGAIREKVPNGQTRPLRSYSTDISAAWEVVEKVGVTLIPVDSGWFALIGDKPAYANPAEFITFIQRGDFANGGAAVGESAPLTICLAAVRALEKLQIKDAGGTESSEGDDTPVPPPTPIH